MPIQFRCPQCKKLVQAPDAAAGKSAKCPACGQATTVPSDELRAGREESAQEPTSFPGITPTPVTGQTRKRIFPLRLVIVLAALVLGVFAFNAFNSETPPEPVTTVTTMPDAFRRLELRGYRFAKDSNALGLHFVTYKRKEADAEFTAELTRWSGDDQIKNVIFSCYTDEKGFKSGESTIDFWDKMKHDMYALVNARGDYLRAVNDLHPVKEAEGQLVLRRVGRATTEEGWQILVIEDVRHYKPLYENPDKFWARVGMILVTNLQTNEDIPTQAILEFEHDMEELKSGSEDD